VLIPGTQEKTIRDDLGFPFILRSAPQRIVSLAPNITEILFALGLEARVVGVTRYCDFPPEAEKKEKIGGMLDPDLEKIKALNPDLVVSFRGNPLRTIDKLRSLGFPVFVLDMGKDLGSVYQIIEKIGRATRQEEAAAGVSAELRKRERFVSFVLQGADRSPEVFLLLPGEGLWTCGRESYLHDLLLKAKAQNVAGRIKKRWLSYNAEQLIRDNPEAIILMAKSREDFEKGRGKIISDPLFREIRAVRTNHIYFLDENLASRFGPRLFEALEAVARLLHPGQFRKV
jgi:iron complex transport system substrate-binding protein